MDSNFKAKEVMCVADETAKVVSGFIQCIEYYMLGVAAELSDVSHLKNAVRTDLELPIFLTSSQADEFRDRVFQTLGIVDGVVISFHKFTIAGLANRYAIWMLKQRIVEMRAPLSLIDMSLTSKSPSFKNIDPWKIGKSEWPSLIAKPLEFNIFDYEVSPEAKQKVMDQLNKGPGFLGEPVKLKTKAMEEHKPFEPGQVEQETKDILHECRKYAVKHGKLFFEYLSLGGVPFREEDLMEISLSLLADLHRERVPYGRGFMLFLLSKTHPYWRDCRAEPDLVKWLLVLNNSSEVWGAFEYAETHSA